MPHYSEVGFKDRLSECAVNITHPFPGHERNRNSFFIPWDYRANFPELKLTHSKANELLYNEGITSIGLLQTYYMVDIIHMPEPDSTVSCLGTPIEKWLGKMLFADPQTVTILFSSPVVPQTQKDRYAEITQAILAEQREEQENAPAGELIAKPHAFAGIAKNAVPDYFIRPFSAAAEY